MSNRMVQCVKLRRELPGLERVPFPGDLGQRIFDKVSQMAWEMWQQQLTIIINHYGLNMVDPRAQDFIAQQMEDFFFGEDAAMPEGWVPEGQGGGKGAPAAPAKGGGGKGAPAPQRK